MSKSRKKFKMLISHSVKDSRYCSGKLCLSEREAHEHINGIKKRQHYVHSKVIPRRAYPCKECKCWHLTSLSSYIDPYSMD